MTPNYRNIIEPRHIDWTPWEERFSVEPVDKTPGTPKTEPTEDPNPGMVLRLGRGYRRPVGACGQGAVHQWLQASTTQVKCALCRRTWMIHNLPEGTKIWTKEDLRLKVEPRYKVPVCCPNHSHDWRAHDGTGEVRRIRCHCCHSVVPGKLVGE